MSRSETSAPETVDLSPVAFAELLGLTAADAPYLATATTRLPLAWVDSWRTRMGVRELTVSDLSVVLSVTKKSVFKYMAQGAKPRLAARLVANAGSHNARAVSPANLIAFLRERSRLAGVVPVLAETAGQEERRGRRERELLQDLVGRPKPRQK